MDTPSLSRRDWLSASAAILAAAAIPVSRQSDSAVRSEDLILNSRGAYRFLPGVPMLSFGVRAADGFEIARTTFRQPRPFPAGLAEVEQLLRESGRPIQALCGLELRSPRPLSAPEFGAFNEAYIARLEQAGLLIGDRVPLSRTNVAFAGTTRASGKPEVGIHAFSYTMPSAREARAAVPTFVLSGMPEIRNLLNAALRRERPDIVASNDTTPTGTPTPVALRLKTEFILNAIESTMRTLGVQWTDATGVQLYTVHDVQPLVADLILPRIGAAARLGIEWHHAYPPGVQVEIGIRGTHLESIA